MPRIVSKVIETTQDNASELNATVVQDDSDQLNTTVYQSDPTELMSTVYQADPTQLNATVEQADPANLLVTVYQDDEDNWRNIGVGTYTVVNVAVQTASSTRSTLLDPGNYIISCDCDVYWVQGGVTCTAAATDDLLFGGTWFPYELVVTGAADGYFAGITTGNVTGTLKLKRIR